jgi:hypothetical protein
MAFPETTRPLTPPNPLADLAAPIGGTVPNSEHGYLVIIPIGSPPPPSILLDVTRWSGQVGFLESPFAKGGMMGATSTRRVGYAYTWDGEGTMDLRAQIALQFVGPNNDRYLPPEFTCECYFRLGEKFQQAANLISPRYWWVPRAKLELWSPIVNAGDKKKVRFSFRGTSNGHAFLLPDQGDPIGGTGIAGAYYQWLQNNPNA